MSAFHNDDQNSCFAIWIFCFNLIDKGLNLSPPFALHIISHCHKLFHPVFLVKTLMDLRFKIKMCHSYLCINWFKYG